MSTQNFGALIRERRRSLNLTQHQVATLVGVSTPFVGHLEGGTRHPSGRTVTRIADVLGFNRADLLIAANPEAGGKSHNGGTGNGRTRRSASAWEQFRKSYVHNGDIEPGEFALLSKVASMGEVQS